MDRVLSVFLFLLVSLPALHAAPQGATREDRTAVERLGAFAEGLAPDGLPSAVDLRPFLPEVGEQTMNDCAAWAFGYAGRSYLEAIDQGWKPDSDARIFSPTFIYNQVNGGVDQGSRVDRVLELLMEKGAATLQTAPYLAKDFLTQPPLASFEEAKVFPIADFGALPDGTWIRQALGEGHIVLACVRTNPIFSGGHARPYTKEDHARGQAARRPDQPHGFHAMAIVGYSDAREAFLFMNSWGKQWGEDGFLWISYDVLEKFNTDQDTTQLMDFAIVMLDRREPVQRNGGSYEVVALDSLEPHLFATYAGQEGESGADAYRFSLALRGARETMQFVNKVVWQVPGLDGPREVTSQDRAADFRLTGLAPEAAVQVRGTAHLLNGSTVALEASTIVPESWKRDIDLRRIDAFHAAWENGTHTWRWTMLPQMSDTDWQELESIRWSLAGLPDSEAKVYTHAGGLPPQWTMESLAQPSYHTSEPQAITAEFRFGDGAIVQREFLAEPFTSEVMTGAVLDYVARPEGGDGTRGWYFLELQASYPEVWKDLILGVRMGTGTEATWKEAAARQVGGPEPFRHVYATYVDGPFWPDALLYFVDDSLPVGRTTPAMPDGPIDLGPAAAWEDPWPEGKNLDANDRGYGLNYRDRFLGWFDGEPEWEVEVFVDGDASLGILEECVWEFPESVYLDEEATEALDAWIRPRRRIVNTPGPFEAKVRCTDYEGFSFEMTLQIEPRSPMNNALAVDLVTVPVPELEDATPGQKLAEVSLIGLPEDLAGLRSLRAWVRRSWGGILEVPVRSWTFDELVGEVGARVEVAADEPTYWYLEYDDGSGTTVAARTHAAAPVPNPPLLQVHTRERFVGWADGAPMWVVEVDLRGDQARLEAITSIEWEFQPVGGKPAHEGAEMRNRPYFLTYTPVPMGITAKVRFGGGEGDAESETMQAEAYVATLAPRPPDLPELRIDAGFVEEIDPSHLDPYADFGTPQRYRLHVAAGREDAPGIAQVRYQVTSVWEMEQAAREGQEPPRPLEIVVPKEETYDHSFTHILTVPPDDPVSVGAIIVLEDGTEITQADVILGQGEEDVFEVLPDLPALQVQDWGVIDGARHSLLHVSLPPGTWTDFLLRSSLRFDRELKTAGGSPHASFDHGHSLREFLIAAPVKVEGLETLRRDPISTGFEFHESEIHWPAVEPADAIAKPRVRIRTVKEEHGRFHYLSIEASASMLAKSRRVTYDVMQGGKREVYTVSLPMGEQSTAFELRLYGPPPKSVTARLFGEDGFLTKIGK